MHLHKELVMVLNTLQVEFNIDITQSVAARAQIDWNSKKAGLYTIPLFNASQPAFQTMTMLKMRYSPDCKSSRAQLMKNLSALKFSPTHKLRNWKKLQFLAMD
jgi:hypothetical protein